MAFEDGAVISGLHLCCNEAMKEMGEIFAFIAFNGPWNCCPIHKSYISQCHTVVTVRQINLDVITVIDMYLKA